MVKRQVIWSHKARIKLVQILDFYIERNQNKIYSIKLNTEIKNQINILLKQPDIGIKTGIESIRGLIIKDITIFYENKKDYIVIHSIWDCRQNPDDLQIK